MASLGYIDLTQYDVNKLADTLQICICFFLRGFLIDISQDFVSG